MMSATIESKKFADYFGIPVCNRMAAAPILTVSGRSYTVSEYYLEDLDKLGPVRDLGFTVLL